MTNLQLLTIIISCAAFLVALTSLYCSHLTPFKLKVLCDPPTFSMYKISPNISGSKDGKTWWIPSFDQGISFYNLGKLAGCIMDIRIVAEEKGHQSNRKYFFYPKWIVDFTKFQQNRTDRMRWIHNAANREWYPFMVRGASEIHLHIILESDRLDHEQESELTLSFEIAVNKTKWKKYCSYNLRYSVDIFQTDCSYTASPLDQIELRKIV